METRGRRDGNGNHKNTKRKAWMDDREHIITIKQINRKGMDGCACCLGFRPPPQAVDIRAQSVAFPAISCGIYGYPVSSASQIAMRTVKTFLLGSPEAKEPNGATERGCLARVRVKQALTDKPRIDRL